MRLVLWANGRRGAACIEALCEAGMAPSLVVLHARGPDQPVGPAEVTAAGRALPIFAPPDPNDPRAIDRIAVENADVFILAGYGRILGAALLALPRRLAINLHAGKLPEFRGSSPMNWALIEGERSFTLSIIAVDEGVDTGDVLAERTFPIGPQDTIRELHAVANHEFPHMMLDVLEQIRGDRLERRPQDAARARYFPLRFPADGLILWDQLTARQVHNRIRALRPPYPGAFTFYRCRRVLLVASELPGIEYRGEPGRIYRTGSAGLLVCARDRCLWLREATLADDGSSLLTTAQRYEHLATLQAAATRHLTEEFAPC